MDFRPSGFKFFDLNLRKIFLFIYEKILNLKNYFFLIKKIFNLNKILIQRRKKNLEFRFCIFLFFRSLQHLHKIRINFIVGEGLREIDRLLGQNADGLLRVWGQRKAK